MFYIFRKNRKTELLKSGLFTDICILVEDAKFPCHRFMLASASEFFEKMFQKDELDTGEVRLEETTAEVFQIILNFIYTEDEEYLKNLDYTILLKIVQNANMWLLSEVEQSCIKLLRIKAKVMEPELLIELYAVFYLLNNTSFLEELIEVCMYICAICILAGYFVLKSIVTLNLFQLLGEISFSHETSLNVFELSFDCLKDFVQNTSQIFTESERFSMVESWAQKNASQHNSTDNYNSILSTIDFKKMAVKEFRDGPGKSKLLADIDKYEIVSEIALRKDYTVIEKRYFEIITKACAYFYRNNFFNRRRYCTDLTEVSLIIFAMDDFKELYRVGSFSQNVTIIKELCKTHLNCNMNSSIKKSRYTIIYAENYFEQAIFNSFVQNLISVGI